MKLIEINGQFYDMSSPTNEEFRKRIIEAFEETQPEPSEIVSTYWYHIEGFELHLQSALDVDFDVEFYDSTGELIHRSVLRNGMFCKLSRKYYKGINYKVYLNNNLVKEETISYKNKRVFISFDSSSIGDTLAWLPYCDQLRVEGECEVLVSTFMNDLFKEKYKSLTFLERGEVANNIHFMFKFGWFYDSEKEPEHPVTIPLQKVATNILGLEFREVRPILDFTPHERPLREKYVTICTSATSGCKVWNNPNGWQELIDYLNSKGYKVAVIQKESISGLSNFLDWTGDFPLKQRMNEIYHSEFFIGLGSGISWLAWALDKPVVMISNFSEEGHEFMDKTIRIKNESVCHGCWNNPSVKFDKGDWYWCPFHKGTDRQFECHKTITSQMVINQIQSLLQ